MPFHRPIPDSQQQPNPTPKKTPGLNSLVQAEKVMQIAFVLPCGMVVGWGLGWGVDHLLHTDWAVPVGLVLGIIAGMVSAIRMAMAAMNPPSSRDLK
jgi:F0F1-type ATP synthase assembly protein I